MSRAIDWRAYLIVIVVVALCCGAGAFAGRASADQPAPTGTPVAAPTWSLADYPTVDGSTSAQPLQVIVACKLLGVPYVWQESSPFETTRIPVPPLDVTEPSQTVERIRTMWHTGTNQSYLRLIDGSVDFILVARKPSEDELWAANQAGVEFDVRAVALDAFVFLANAANPVDSLPLDTLRDIYTGQINRWSELGLTIPIDPDREVTFIPRPACRGEEDTICAYQRDRNSGSQELMDDLVMKGVAMKTDSPDMILEMMAGPINMISHDVMGIGYSVYYYAAVMLPNEQVKLIGVDGVVPTTATIADRSYPLVTEVYAVVRADMPPASPAVRLRDWLLTEEGQAVVAESGYVPLKPGTWFKFDALKTP